MLRSVPLAVVLGLAAVLAGSAQPTWAQTSVQLSCAGTLLDARGSAELKRDTLTLQVSLGLEAEAVDADSALQGLQRRLADVRQRLQALQVRDLRVTSPSTWQRNQPQGQGSFQVVAQLQVSGSWIHAACSGSSARWADCRVCASALSPLRPTPPLPLRCAPDYFGLPTRMLSPRGVIWRVPLAWFISGHWR